MRALTKWVLLAVVGVAGWSFGQQMPDKPPADKGEAAKKPLEDLLATALRHSPDVQVAQAKVREAEAELRRTRLTLMQRVIEAKGAVEARQAGVAQAEATYKRLTELLKRGALSHEEVQQAEAVLAAAKAQLAQAEAALNALTGTLPGGLGALVGPSAAESGPPPAAPAPQLAAMGGGMVGLLGGPVPGMGGGFTLGGGPTEPPARAPRGSMADKLRAALEAPVKLVPMKDMPLGEVIGSVRGAAKGVPFLLHLGEKAKEPVTLSLEGEVALGAALQALEDVVPGLKCYVREYGILITMEDSVPADAMPLIEFWHKNMGM